MIDRHFIYFPERELFADPAAIGLAFDDVTFEAADGVSLHRWFVPGRRVLTRRPHSHALDQLYIWLSGLAYPQRERECQQHRQWRGS